MPAKCNNPACENETFTASVLRKECNPKFPFLVVKLHCSKCGKEFKVWVVNPQLKELYAMITGREKLNDAMMKAVYEELQKLNEPDPAKRVPFYKRIREIVKL